ncbi:hypothetical protein [Streptomyces echinatus]|uniref:Uncharacterized protein n=1 Tax=Streptomyces echinatus TaxID=67293 RepID=A0A7W9PQ11_9ACTN|nr:hypothetical protein [Streptomyces echinatus]MBB5925736.1 hypothetical protein [Streptomyces echinatus]
MSENTPSQAEGEREADARDEKQPERTTPSQAEGADPADDTTDEDPDPGHRAAPRERQARHGGRPGLSLHLWEEPKTPIHEEFDR